MADTTPEKKPQIYEESSQYQHWRFSPDQLWDIRNKSEQAAVERVKRNVLEDLAASGEPTNDKVPADYLSTKEELELCRYYEWTIKVMNTFIKYPESVMATAIIYLKRFFLYNSVMDYHPKDILLTCLFLALKSESERISIEEFCKKCRVENPQPVLDLEFTVSQGLKFQYYVHHPYRPAYGFFLDMQTGPTDIKLLKETYKKVFDTIAQMLLSDLPFMYQPTQLALAAYMIAGETNGFKQQVKTYIADRFADKQAQILLTVIDKITKVYRQIKEVDKEEAKKIDLKLKYCKNPAMNPESALYKKRLAERQEGTRESKRFKPSSSFDTSEENSPESIDIE